MPTEAGNLCYACTVCNRSKGTDVGSIAPTTGEFTRFFNPRTDAWDDHFALSGAAIEPLTTIGETTARILEFNSPERIQERDLLLILGTYPAQPVQE